MIGSDAQPSRRGFGSFRRVQGVQARHRVYEQLFSLKPAWDRPRFASRLCLDALCFGERGGRWNAGIAIQHHHAHMASCMAENGLDEPVIGVTFDGSGFGTDAPSGAVNFLSVTIADSSAGAFPVCRTARR